MTKSRNFKSLSLAHSWLESRGFAKPGQSMCGSGKVRWPTSA